MTKRKEHLAVKTDLSDIFASPTERRKPPQGYPIEKALATVVRQMRAAGRRQRTIDDYELHVEKFAEATGVKVIEEITAAHIYEWLSSMDVNNQTKLTRLKCLKAFLSKCKDNGWLQSNFWKIIQIKVDNPVKEGTTDKELNLLLTLLDLSRFTELRDATAALTMYQTGLRVGTLSLLEEKHVNLDEQLIRVDGGIIKNHEPVYLPFDDVLKRLLTTLIEQNDIIRKKRRQRNDFIFITKDGGKVTGSTTHNNIIKRLNKYAKDFGLKNINAQALRRGFAKNLLNKKANIVLISKALGHRNIEVTTRYLHLDKEEVAESLRDFL